MKAIKFLTSKQLDAGIRSIYPVKFCTAHVTSSKRKNSWLYIIGGTFFILFKLLFQSFKTSVINTEKKYDVLFYVPNIKYERFLRALTKNVNFSFLVLSEDASLEEGVSVKNFRFISYRFYTIDVIKAVFQIYIYAIQTKQLKAYKTNYWHIFNVIRRDLLVDRLFKTCRFNKYFSFHPVGDFHQIVQGFHKHQFINTYAIRPTTTAMAEEHKYINTDNLFYKTEIERKVYNSFQFKNTNLLAGGLIIEAFKVDEQTLKDGILFLDTCTNKSPNSLRTRRNAVSNFLKHTTNINEPVFYKFHPGLIDSEVVNTKLEIEKLSHSNILIVEDIPWNKLKIAIGFDTTLFYDCFFHKIPILSFAMAFDLFPNIETEFCNSPILKINNNKEFNKMNKLLSDKQAYDLQINKQSNWFKETYNFPEGMYKVREALGS